MARTNTTAVQTLLGDNYGPSEDGQDPPDLQQFIDWANPIVSRAAAQAAGRVIKPITLTAVELEMMERCLAAHGYCVQDPLYTSRSTGGGSGSFARSSPGEGFESSEYGKMAVRVDYSGALKAIGIRATAGGAWAGKTLSQQIPYDQRQ